MTVMAPVTSRSAPPGALYDGVLAALGRRIVSGDLRAGDVLTLDQITVEQAVSRSVAREAVRVLESMGLLASRRRVGSTVLPRARWNLFDPRVIRWRLDGPDQAAQLASLSELRRGFEPAAAALAAIRANADQCRILAAAASDMVIHGDAGELEPYLAVDKIFHLTVLEASGNEMFGALDSVVAEVLVGRTHHGLMPDKPNPVAIALHDDVARAVRLRDPHAAETAMRGIIDEAARAVADRSSP